MPADMIILLLLLPLTAAIICMLLTGKQGAQRIVCLSALSLNALLAIAGLLTVYHGAGEPGGILVSQAGNWPAPFGITLVMDPLAGIMLAVAAFTSLAVYIYCVGQMPVFLQGGFFTPLLLLLILGVQWSFLTGDIFNLFVAFEIMLLSSYVLLVMGTSSNQLRHAYKYILLNLLSSLLFVSCCGLIYGQLGTLNMADLARITRDGLLPPESLPVFALLLVVFGVKTAIFPLWFWLPDTYATMHPAIGGLFAGLLTKVGAYVMIRTFVLILGHPNAPIGAALSTPILISAGVTMFLGVLGAVSMSSIRQILSIHIISQVGYMILGIGLAIAVGQTHEARVLAVAGAIFFVIHNMVVKTALFLCGGLMRREAGSDYLPAMGGLAKTSPWLATLFIVAALSLAGLPPLSGFFGKWILLRQTFDMGFYWLAGFAIATSLFTLMSMLKIWSYGFWSTPHDVVAPLPTRADYDRLPEKTMGMRLGMISTGALVVVALSMGFGATTYFNISHAAAEIVVNPDRYIDAVLDPNQQVHLSHTAAATPITSPLTHSALQTGAALP